MSNTDSHHQPLIWLLQGPGPWPVPLGTLLTGLALLIFVEPMTADPYDIVVFVIAAGLFLLGAFWIFARQSEKKVYSIIDKIEWFQQCPICQYDFAGLGEEGSEPDTCPECGVDLAQLRQEAKAIARRR